MEEGRELARRAVNAGQVGPFGQVVSLVSTAVLLGDDMLDVKGGLDGQGLGEPAVFTAVLFPPCNQAPQASVNQGQLLAV